MSQKYLNFLHQSIKEWRFWAKLLIGISQITSIIVFLIVASAGEGYVYAIPEQLSYFTTQANVFCGIFFIYSAMFHHNEGKGRFDNSEVTKIAITYVSLVIIIYNINQLMAKNPYFFDSWKFVMSFVCEHSLIPLLAIIYYLFFYNHEKAKNIKVFSKKWVWFMIMGLIGYIIVFSIIGEIAKIYNWKPLYETMDGSGESSTFVYPFMDWYHGMGLFKQMSPWLECIIILTVIISVTTVIEYLYTLIILKVKNSKNISQKNLASKQDDKKYLNVIKNEIEGKKYEKKLW